jgi:hypothetical protein
MLLFPFAHRNTREVGWVEHVACTWEKRNAYRVLMRKPEGEEHFKPRCTDGINMNYLSIFLVLWQLSPSSGTQTPFLSV